MKRSKSEVNINPLLHDLPETTQQFIRGGTSIEANEGNSTETAQTPVIGGHGYIKIKKLDSGG
ncbi:hypothetical protein IFO70_23620 [Phormidium tenue FACHB-886]|nr:hypothetical protein [Phormidium tenue FACHB-886]